MCFYIKCLIAVSFNSKHYIERTHSTAISWHKYMLHSTFLTIHFLKLLPVETG